MHAVRTLIESNLDRYPDFAYLYLNIDKAVRNHGEYNDVVIDCSKSLIEAVCKNILVALSEAEDHVSADKYKLKKVFEKAITEISKYHDPLDSKIVSEMVDVVVAIGKVRNSRGDVSHGHVSPKNEASCEFFAKFVMQSSARICEYLLTLFYQINLDKPEATLYEDNPAFNDFIDDAFKLSLEEKADYVDVIYSAALYEQDYDDYYERLLEYLADNEESFDDE